MHSFNYLRTLTFMAALGSACHAPAAEPPPPRIAAEIKSILDAQRAAWNRGDIDAYMKGYDRSAATVFVSGDTLTRGWQTVRERYKKKYDSRAKMGTLSFSEVQVTPLSNDAALVSGRWELSRQGGNPCGRFTLLFRHTPQGWRIVHDHTSAAEK